MISDGDRLRGHRHPEGRDHRGHRRRATTDFGCPAAGKTGTTEGESDAWFVGYTPRISTAVWVGYPDARTSMGSAAFGGTYAGRSGRSTCASAIGSYCSDFHHRRIRSRGRASRARTRPRPRAPARTRARARAPPRAHRAAAGPRPRPRRPPGLGGSAADNGYYSFGSLRPARQAPGPGMPAAAVAAVAAATRRRASRAPWPSRRAWRADRATRRVRAGSPRSASASRARGAGDAARARAGEGDDAADHPVRDGRRLSASMPWSRASTSGSHPSPRKASATRRSPSPRAARRPRTARRPSPRGPRRATREAPCGRRFSPETGGARKWVRPRPGQRSAADNRRPVANRDRGVVAARQHEPGEDRRRTGARDALADRGDQLELAAWPARLHAPVQLGHGARLSRARRRPTSRRRRHRRRRRRRHPEPGRAPAGAGGVEIRVM